MPALNDPLYDIDDNCRNRIEAERIIPLEVYRQNGAEDRLDHFLGLHLNYGIDVADVIMIADSLGPEEDFKGLITAIEDGACG